MYDNIVNSEENILAYEKRFHKDFPENKIDKNKLPIYIWECLDRTNVLLDVINTTTDEKEFFLSLNEINRTLYDLTSYENMFDFKELPSATLKMLYENRVQYIDKLYIRIKEKCEKEFDNMEGHEFEHFCAGLLQKAGYTDIEVTKGSGDNGIDVLAGKEGIKYGIQCKCYASDIGVKAVQEAYSGARYYDCHVPVVLTNRFFTKPAQELAKKIKVLLWDREVLESLVSTYMCA